MDAQRNHRRAEDLAVRVFELTEDLPDAELARRLRTRAVETLSNTAEILGALDPEYALVAVCGTHQDALKLAALVLLGQRLGHFPPDADAVVRGYGDLAADVSAWLDRPRGASSTFVN